MPEATPAVPGQDQQQAPLGHSSITGPTPNKGYEAAAKQRLGVVLKQLTGMLDLVGPTSDIGKKVLKWISEMSKMVQPGEVSQASERSQIERMALQNTQQGQNVAQMRGGAQQPQQGQPQQAQPPQPGAMQ